MIVNESGGENHLSTTQKKAEKNFNKYLDLSYFLKIEMAYHVCKYLYLQNIKGMLIWKHHYQQKCLCININ